MIYPDCGGLIMIPVLVLFASQRTTLVTLFTATFICVVLFILPIFTSSQHMILTPEKNFMDDMKNSTD